MRLGSLGISSFTEQKFIKDELLIQKTSASSPHDNQLLP